jgi:hypothetical protein
VVPGSGFRVVAIVAAYNEADVIGRVVADLVQQGVEVYLLDDGSTDGTVEAVRPRLGRGVLAIESLPETLPDHRTDRFEWARILARKTAIARALDADWIIHHDADELRESPWPGVGLRDAIARVDRAGYNAIDFASFDFWPVDDGFRPGDDPRAAFPYCAPAAPYDGPQVRCWKNEGPVDLASSGGHDARFEGRRVFPLRFILRHYPIRGQAHGERKVLRERRPRFLDEERARGWHVQYDAVAPDGRFVRDPATLTRFDGDAVRLALTLVGRDAAGLEAELTAARERASHLERVVDGLRGQVEDARRAGLALEGALADRDAAVARLQRDLDGLAARIAAIEDSLSWRVTAPARAALRFLKGGA